MTMMRWITLIACTLLVTPTSAAEPEEKDYRGLLDQARFQLKKGYLDQALLDLRATVAHPVGRNDAEAWYLLAQVYIAIGEYGPARDAIHRACSLAADGPERDASESVRQYLEQEFGIIEIGAIQPGTTWKPVIHRTDRPLEPRQREAIETLVDSIAERRPVLPMVLVLPKGQWTINGEQVEISPDSPASLKLSTASAAGGMGIASVGWLDIGAGLMTVISSQDTLQPSTVFQASFNVPVTRRWIFAVMSDWLVAVHPGPLSDYRVQTSLPQVGARVGPLLNDGGTWQFRPALGIRFGATPGWGIPCERVGDGFEAICGNVEDDITAYIPATTTTFSSELGIDYLDRRKRSGLGAGLRVQLDYSTARLNADAIARVGGFERVRFTQGTNFPERATLRLLGHVTLAF